MRLFLLSTLFLLQGCVGIASIHDRTDHLLPTQYGLGPAKGFLINSRFRGSCCGGDELAKNKDDLLRVFGKPDEIVNNGGVEGWRYNKNISWAVIVPQLIVPIPIGVPTGHSGVTFYFSGPT